MIDIPISNKLKLPKYSNSSVSIKDIKDLAD